MQTAVYIRTSTVGQNQAGQRREIERWLAGNGIDDAIWFMDRKSGDHLDRPAFARLQAAVFAGEVRTVVVWKLDRLSRNLRDGINVLADWCERGLRVVSVTQQLDFTGAVGKMLAAVLLGIAEMEQETRRERQAVGIAALQEKIKASPKLRQEKYPGRKPGTTKADSRRALALRRKGNTDAEIAQVLGVTRRTVQRYVNA